jgi:hypothetical protein
MMSVVSHKIDALSFSQLVIFSNDRSYFNDTKGAKMGERIGTRGRTILKFFSS